MAWFRDHRQGGKLQHVQGGISPSSVVPPVQVQEDTVWEKWPRPTLGGARTGWEGVGAGLTMGWGGRMCASQGETQGWREGSRLHRLAFLEGALRLEPFPGHPCSRWWCFGSGFPAADTAHSRDAAAAVGHVASADRAGRRTQPPLPLVLLMMAAGESRGQQPAGTARGWARGSRLSQDGCSSSWDNRLAGGPSHSQLPPTGDNMAETLPRPTLGLPSLYSIQLILNSQRATSLVQAPTDSCVILDTSCLFC